MFVRQIIQEEFVLLGNLLVVFRDDMFEVIGRVDFPRLLLYHFLHGLCLLSRQLADQIFNSLPGEQLVFCVLVGVLAHPLPLVRLLQLIELVGVLSLAEEEIIVLPLLLVGVKLHCSIELPLFRQGLGDRLPACLQFILEGPEPGRQAGWGISVCLCLGMGLFGFLDADETAI